MNNKLFSLLDLVKISHNSTLSEPYVRYLCGLGEKYQYRHQEILDICKLITNLRVPEIKLDGFIYGYIVPQLNNEFDLLKITQNICLDLEIKSADVSLEKISKQLKHHRHFLKLLNKQELFLYTYVSETNRLYKLDSNETSIECPISELTTVLNMIGNAEPIDLDQIFTPNNILVSPLNATDRFLRKDYLLTDNQETIKKEILTYIRAEHEDKFISLTGGPGTGKTLLIYDLARDLSETHKILLIHSGILCNGHSLLDSSLRNIKIIAAKELRWREIKDVDIVIVDEAHRLYTTSLDKIINWVRKSKTTCIFSLDAGQMLSAAEERRNTSKQISELCDEHTYKLTNKIRTNKELALFITCLRDLSKYRSEYKFPNVKVVFEPDKKKALNRIKDLEQEGYTYISYTPSTVNHELDYQVSVNNTHNVIGQEFDGVCMQIDDYFYYSADGKLKAKSHPNPDYLFEKLLYQGLTRVRSKIALVILSETILQSILPLMGNE